MKKIYAFFVIIFTMFSHQYFYANGGIGYKGIYINNKGAKTWYKVHDVSWGYNGCGNFQFNSAAAFNAQNLGNFNENDVLEISGYAVVGWTDSADWVSSELQYKIWKQGDTEPLTWSVIDVGNYGNCAGSTQVVCNSGNDKVVGYDNGNLNIKPSSPGIYNFKVKALGRMQYNCGNFNTNDGAEMTATFTVNPIVTFNGNGSTSGSMSNQSVTYNTATSLTNNSYVRTGYTFTGWNTATNGSGTSYANSANVTLTNNLLLYAQWFTAPTISTDTILGSPFCAGSAISVPYTTTGTFNSGNTFTAQLSDKNGSFATPSTIGTLSSVTSGTISATIPSDAVFGSGYKIRVVSSNPIITGTENGANLTVYPIQFFANLETQNQTICSGSNIINGNITGRLYIDGITNNAGQGSNVTVEFGYNSTNNNPNTWSNWYSATYKEDSGNDDRYTINGFGSALTSGTYYYTFRYRVGTCDWVYGGYNTGNWNGTTNVNGVLTVNSAPSITVQPSSTVQTLCKDISATALSITATGSNLTYQWYSNTANSNSGGNSILGATTSTYTPNTSTVGTLYYYVIVSNIGCTSATSNVSGAVTITSPGVWTGTTNTDWATASNWCGGVPTNATDVVIPSTAPNMPTISANAVAKSVTIDNGATLNNGTGNLTLSGNFTNNGIYNYNTGTITVSNTGTQFLGSTIPYTFYNLVLNGGATFSAQPTIINILNIKAGGFVTGSSPIYASGSFLKYNTGGNFGIFTEWTETAIPHHVIIGDEVTNSELNLGAITTFRQANGDITVGTGTQIAKLTLSTNSGGDIKLKGNYTVSVNSSTINMGRAFFFIGDSGNQIVTKNGGGTIYFDYLFIDKNLGDLQLSGSVGQITNVQINSIGISNIYQLELINGSIDLNDQIFTMRATNAQESTENTTNIKISGSGVKRIYTSTGSGDFIFDGNYSSGKSNAKFNFASSATLTFDANVTLQTSVGLDFGTNGSTLINSIFQINRYGFVIVHTPDYGNSSTLIYNNGSSGFYRNMEWVSNAGAGYPNNVIIKGNNNTLVELDGINPLGYPVPNDIGCSGNLTIESGATLKLNNMAFDLYVEGNINMAGNLHQATFSGSDIYLKGNWIQSGAGILTPNNRTVFFNKQSTTIPQTILGSTTFDNLTLNNEAGLDSTGTTDNNTINQNLLFSNGKITINTNNLIIGSSGNINGYDNNKYIVTNNTGQLKRTLGNGIVYPVGSASAYNPITLSNSGTSDVYGIRTIYGDITDARNISDANDFFDQNAVLKLKWQITEAVSGGSILTPIPEWNLADQGTNFSICSSSVNLYIGNYTWLEADATYSSNFRKTATPISGNTISPTDLSSGNHYITVGDVHDTTTYLGNATTGSWNKCIPNFRIKAIIVGTFDTSVSSGTNFEAKRLTVNTGGNLSIKANNFVVILNEVINNGNLTVENDGNLVQINNSTNTGSITVRRNANLKRLDYNYWGSPVSGQQFNLFSPATISSRFYEYHESDDLFHSVSWLTNFVAGKGYAIRAPNNYTTAYQTFNGLFSGVPNNGSITQSLQYTTVYTSTHKEAGYNLIANPYPSNIDFNELVNDNSSLINNLAYFWTNNYLNPPQQGSFYTQENYAVYNGSGGIPSSRISGTSNIPTSTIKVGQGFMVSAKEAGTLTFNNRIRTISNVGFFFNSKKINEEKDRFWLELITPVNNVNTILLAYVKGATNNLDGDYDAKKLSSSSDEFYSYLPTNDYNTLKTENKLLIQGKATPLLQKDKILLGATYFENGKYTIKLSIKEGVFNNGQAIYLKDNKEKRIVNLQEETSYEFETAAGEVNDRFEIVYQPDGALSVTDSKDIDLSVYKENDSYKIISKNKIENVAMYDTSGKLIITIKPNAATASISSSKLIKGVYILKIKTEGKIITKKVIK